MGDCKCDFCGDTARYDGKTIRGPWAYMCEDCFVLYGRPIKGLYTDLKELAARNANKFNKEDNNNG